MTWFVIELLRDDPSQAFTPDLFIGKARLNEDETITWLWDAVPPRGARTTLVPIPVAEANTVPDIDFVKPLTDRERRQARAVRGRGRG